ncbi:unnamed protein product [Caenorhabditis brenneri]
MKTQTVLIFILLTKCQGIDEAPPKESNLQLLFDDIAILARVTNAIALQSSVARKTFDAKAVIADIYKLNPANLSDILRHDTLKFASAWDEVIEGYQKVFRSTEPFFDKDKELVAMNENLLNAIAMDYDVKESVIHEFFGRMVQEDNIETLLACPKDVVTTVLNFWNVMNNQSSLSGLLTENQEKSALESMKFNIQNISDCMDSFEDYQEFTDPILEQGKIFQKVVYARDMLKKLKESKYNYSEYSTQLENVRKMISLTVKDFKKPKLKLHEQIETTIQLFKDLRNKLLIPERTLTVGFGNFGTLREDIRSEWFKSKISKQKSTVIMENALKQFMEFGVLVDEMWTTFMEYRSTFNSDQNTRDMLWVANVWKKIDEFEDWKGDEFLKRTIGDFNSCWKSNGYNKSIFSDYDSNIDELIKLNRTTANIVKWVNETIGTMDSEVIMASLRQLESLDFESKNLLETKELIRESTRPNFQFLMDYFHRFKELKSLQERFQKRFESLRTSRIHQILIKTIKNLNDSTVTRDLKCLKSKSLDARRVENLFSFVENVRHMSEAPTAGQMKNHIEYYDKFRKSYINLTNYVKEKMKGGEKGQEVLLKFENSAKISHALGAGIQALAKIEEAFMKREFLLASLNYSKHVNDQISKFNQHENTRNFWKNDPKPEILKFIKDMDAFNEYCGTIRNKDILTIRNVFVEAIQVPGIPGYDHFFGYINEQMRKVVFGDKHYEFAKNNSFELSRMPMDFTSYKGDFDSAKLSIQEIKNYFDEIFDLKEKSTKKKVENSYLVIGISIPLFFIMLSCVLLLHARSENGKRMYKNAYLYYFGKPKDFEKRWRYSLFLDRQDGHNALIEAVREINLQNVQQIVRRGAYINVYNEHGNTPLHMATKLGYPEIVEVLIKNGADRSLLNAQNRTPEQMIGESVRSVTSTSKTTVKTEKVEKSDIIEQIYKKYQKKKFRIRVPEVFPSSSFHIYADQNTEDQLTNRFLNAFQSIATTELLATTTHIIVKTDFNGILELDRLQILIWILSGVILVKESWMTDCLNDSKIIEKDYNYLVEKVRYKGVVYSTVTQWTEALAKGAMPYLYGVYVIVTIPEYTNYPAIASIVTAHGGTVLEGFPEKHQYNIGTHPYLHANLGPFFVIHDGKRDLKYYKNHRDKMYTLFTEEEFVRFLLKREIHRDTRVNLNSVMIDGED